MLANLNTATHPDEIDSNALKLQILDFLRKRWNFYSCAVTFGLRRSKLYEWMKEDGEFASQIAEIKDSWLDGCEEKNFIEGVQDKNAVTQRIFMLKCHRPEVYGDRYDVNVTETVELNLNEHAAKALGAYLESRKIEGASIEVIEPEKAQTGKT